MISAWRSIRISCAILLSALFIMPSAATAAPPRLVEHLKITVLSTMLADEGLGEWGYAALVEADGHRILFDTGANPDVVLRNAEALHIDLSTVEDVVISHNHSDHTGGLIALREALLVRNPSAMSRVHVSGNMFLPRLNAAGADLNEFTPLRAPYSALSGQIVTHDGPIELAPGVWFTGPVPRRYPETNWSTEGLHLAGPSGPLVDNVPEDAALVFATRDGLVVLTGCGHAGIVNIANYARDIAGRSPVVAVIGGLHLFAKPAAVVDWTGRKLRDLGLRYLLAGHCTGVEATFQLRRSAGLTRDRSPVSAVGSSFTLGQGIAAGAIAG